MTKRAHFTSEEVLDHVLCDSEEDFSDEEKEWSGNDFDVPMADGSDDEFSDLGEVDDDIVQTPINSITILPGTPQASSTHSLSSLLKASSTISLSSTPALSLSPVSSLSKAISPVANNQSNTDNVDWSSALSYTPLPLFASPVGPTVLLPNSPSRIFDLFFTQEMICSIVQETNRYAQQIMGNTRYHQWTPISDSELKAYFGFCILMGIVCLPAIEDYWKKDQHLNYDPISSRISRDRFRDIRRYLHFTDNTTTPQTPTTGINRLKKIWPLLTAVRNRCQDLYQPHREVAVDEAMIKFQGRSSIKQYMPMKPTKRGIKVWVLADSKNGYFYRWQVYTGREGSNTGKGLGSRVVEYLTEPLKLKNHHVYFDNFFTSVKLMEDLEKNGIYACGTAREDRKDFPRSLKQAKLSKRGDYKTLQRGRTTVSVWKDQRVVKVISTTTDPTKTTTVLRRQRDGSRIAVPCPTSIQDYNKYMGGVDMGDQLRGYYKCRTKFRKFYMYIFTFLLDVVTTNSYILYTHYLKTPPTLKSVKDFRLQLAKELIGDYSSRQSSRVLVRPLPLPLQHFPTLKIDGKRGRCKNCTDHKRRSDTRWYCTACNEWLCHTGVRQTDCFLMWHSK